MSAKYVPGMRVEIRDEQWIVRKVEWNSSKNPKTKEQGQTLYVQGLSKFVKDIEAIFLDNIEEIKIIKPEETKLVFDSSANFIKSRLYIESKLRKKMPTDNKLYIGHKAAMNLMDYQLTPSIMALENTRQRILIADAVGLGKTLEAGILMSELIARGKGKRILVVTVKSMMTQFQKEMWSRFSIPLTRLDSNEIKKVKKKIPSNHNPFNYYDKTIVSVDTLKRDVQYKTYLENARWDIIVIDEAHNVAKRGNSEAQRARLAELLSKKSETLIMLSATPHDGKAKSFASLMNMLDPTAIANEDDYTKEDIKGLCVRRFKKDIQDQAGFMSEGEKEPKRITDYYRLLARNMISLSGERSLVITNIHKKIAHINTCNGIAFKSLYNYTLFSASCFSIPFDFLLKISNKGLLATLLKDFPLIKNTKYDFPLILRGLSLNSITTNYSELWEEMFKDEFRKDTWTKDDIRLTKDFFKNLTPNWQRNNALRYDFERRQALVEIDVLVAMALGLTLDELITIYRIQFPVMQQTEQDTYYDKNGRIVWTNSKGLTGVGMTIRKEWDEVKDYKEGQTVSKTFMDDTQPGGAVERTIIYEAPFEKFSREEDYEIAWRVFEERLKDM